MVKIQKYIRVNQRIRAAEVRLIGPEGEQLGVVHIRKAVEVAQEHGLDLIEVAPQAKPPVCRILDFSKYKYDQEKKEREIKKHSKPVHLKEIRVKPHIDEHDYQVKLRQLHSFVSKKAKVKVNLFFRGREMAHRELGMQVLNRFIADSLEACQVEKGPVMQGRIMSVTFSPKHTA
ncbi:translation initiation factor IF-3 [Candidatus Omnitrophota bacterium]